MSNKKDVAVKISGGKRIREAREKVKSDALYNLTNAIERLKSASYVKFDPTLEIVMKLGIDPRHSDQMVRGVVNLPAGTGKTVRVAVICKEEREEEAKSAGADLVGSTNIIDEIKIGKINFDVCIATPDMMVAIGSVARILGPKGLMPNPKLGTVTLDIKNAIKNAKSGQVEYRAEKAGIIHAGLGKLSFPDQDLLKNLNTFIEAVVKAKPVGLKGSYLKAMYLSSTMGVSVQIDLTSIA
ncbi:50S ribosomal protein L1 [Rickettsia endosymbiont of Cantharis rufa]|uniref:50S ribosomal protein L1 n=1 Tax=Rickettsia endosymbiont of Cantharis rufa TaxID=3066248 RepID=UPI003133197C